MSSHSVIQNNVNRFSGFEDDYNRYRPEAPQKVLELLTTYLGRRPGAVADLGCGTGLSTFVWKGHADRIVGVEPNDDMRGKALSKLAADAAESISFVKGYSDRLELADESIDLVTCSQSFHWMEPVGTLSEVARVLTDGGVFAAYDCDWPPVIHWEVESAYERLLAKSEILIAELIPEQERAVKADKEQHLGHIRASGKFKYAREIVFHNMERCDADRYVGIALSQGGVRAVQKQGSKALDGELAEFREVAERYFAGRELDVLFSYRLRLGVK
ncbi:class I SAM-dependent methyltransferase [Paenibacillus harenae]|uniref:Ubiquinone/menaquinone biosynthesis C-methylase UbiE n=1 Tax=Paenibacillus harenae TaxID=306543 RepID=A0ABT9U531_PAEHA|nr:class I SAM-dependent methyltransferase [Paenibacillus harenae]MDQ0114756.1 ubiquinone/menaquinone biosynthesis C-methylase UbiE [Paenibacillus harenae]